MSKEKIIKKQARESLQGNISILIAGGIAICAMILLFEYAAYLAGILLGVIDITTDEIVAGGELTYLLLSLGEITLIALASPFINGFLKAAANTAIYKRCESTDLFCFFSDSLLYLKTIVINMALCMMWLIISMPFEFIFNLIFEEGGFMGILNTVIVVLWKIIIYLFFVHYPLAAYAIDDSKSVGKYIFGYIGFSFRNCGKILKLIFSMLGWILLCFFVLPMLYVVPYLAVAIMNSARWLFALEEQ